MQRCVPSLEIICRERRGVGVGVGVASGGVKKIAQGKGGTHEKSWYTSSLNYLIVDWYFTTIELQ